MDDADDSFDCCFIIQLDVAKSWNNIEFDLETWSWNVQNGMVFGDEQAKLDFREKT
jgi:hypothetical protein